MADTASTTSCSSHQDSQDQAEDQSNPQPNLCAHCHQPATLTCTGCKNAPSNLTSPSSIAKAKQTWYCSRPCQLAHWPTHKPTCIRLQHLTRFARAATLLQRLWYTFRAATFDALITDIRVVHSSSSDPNAISRIDAHVPPHAHRHALIYPFPTHLLPPSPPSHAARARAAVLSMMECGHAHAHLAATIAAVLAPVAQGPVQTVGVHPVVRDGAARYVFESGPRAEVPGERLAHMVMRVRGRGGEVFAIDLTGAQYGWGWEDGDGEEERCWMLWGEFVATRAVEGKVLEVQGLGEAGESVLAADRVLEGVAVGMLSANGESVVGAEGAVEFYEEVVKVWDGAVREWMRRDGGFEKLLRLPEGEYEGAVARLVEYLEGVLVGAVARLQT